MHNNCHSVNYPSDDTDVLAGRISSGWNSLVVSRVILLPRLNQAIVTEPQHFSTAASCTALSRDNREHGHTGVRMCPALSARPGSSRPGEWAVEKADWDPGGPSQTGRSFTARTVRTSLGSYRLTGSNREICQALKKNKEVERVCAHVCVCLWRCDECCLAIRQDFRGRSVLGVITLSMDPPWLFCTQLYPQNQPPC